MSGKRAGILFSAVSAAVLFGLASWLIPATRSTAQEPSYAPAPLPDAGQPPAPVPQNADPAGQQALTNGPVHEAFAEPTSANPQPPMVVPKEPPAPVQEMPPDVKPDGQNVVWIPGYWAWDDGRQDFIWVSGIWRDTPPNHAWVSGYWTGVNGGFQWTPGVWAPSNVEQVNYVPQPPQSLENGASTPAPTPNDFWVPGHFEYVNANWAWSPGYWTAAQPGWIWSPAHYVWTPSGYLFMPGHWDYELSHRGVLFAPVAFDFGYWGGRPIYYGPAVVIDPGVLTVDFFVRPGYYHYYFGDCYGPAYVGWGFHPWFSVGVGFDPIFTYYRWYNVRRDPGWAIRVNQRYAYMDVHPEARPPRTYALSIRVGAPGGVRVGVTLTDYARRPGGPARFERVSMAQRQEYARDAARSNEVGRQRAMAEAHGGGRPGARALDMHEISRTSGGHLPGATPGRTGSTVDRSYQNNNRGSYSTNGRTTTPNNTGRQTTTAPNGARTGTTPGQTTRPAYTPSRQPPNNNNKNSNDRSTNNNNNNGGGHFFVEPDRAAMGVGLQVPPEPQPDKTKTLASVFESQQANQANQANQTNQAAVMPAQQGAAVFGTFGGLISPNAAGGAAFAIGPGTGGNGNGYDAAAMQNANGKDPIKPLILAPELSPQLNPQLMQPAYGSQQSLSSQQTAAGQAIAPNSSQTSPQLPSQLSLFGSGGVGYINGQLTDGILPVTQGAFLQQVGNPTMRDSSTDPIRPLTLVPQTTLPLGQSQTGFPSVPGNPATDVSQKDPVRPLTLVPPNGNGS